MAAIWFSQGELADHLHEVLGYKSGLAASIEHMCDLLSGSSFTDDIVNSEEYGIRIRSEDYEELYYELLHKVGVTATRQHGMIDIFSLSRRIAEAEGFEFAQNLFEIYHQKYEECVESAVKQGKDVINPETILSAAQDKYGDLGHAYMLELIIQCDQQLRNSPHSSSRWQEWNDIVDLEDLFTKHHPVATHGTFIDQRFINFLSSNEEKLGQIHWRKFEELVGECFEKSGFRVELGPGSNDDGVDLRVWNEENEKAPEYIIQCKRQKSKIDRVTVKGLYADVLEEKAGTGLLVTSSEFSPGARKTVMARGYPIKEINGQMVNTWLKNLRTPGSGIVRV